MPTRASKQPRLRSKTTDPDDPTRDALRVVEQAIGEPLTDRRKAASEAARALSALGASKGGHARAAKLSKKRREQIARNAAKARWIAQKRRKELATKAVKSKSPSPEPRRRQGGQPIEIGE